MTGVNEVIIRKKLTTDTTTTINNNTMLVHIKISVYKDMHKLFTRSELVSFSCRQQL